ncbi:hypothetical protein HBI42_036190 [Parastagonospora nodorum]|nr:hypothetical protein HBI12_037940 [Parastagonospora nodorum]KAH6230353.1 hypothetical protein HBI43_044340 [Parastagonospora nodorum]KAH6269875.1 hypothetical protein HBI42_036190 [Parastagonospora nodorum]
MPRQLPWLSTGGGSKTKLKQPPRARTNRTALSDVEDDFFDGTVLASSSKGKGKAALDDKDSEDDLPNLPTGRSTVRNRSGTKDASIKERAPSSSPPPIADHIQPQIEYMRKATSKFDLRDDEWMMVEDEFLETAKLFTRHLHIAEYEKLKKSIEAKKKEQVQAPRPVVAGAKLSAEGQTKKKAETQAKRQHKAIRDVFASQDDENEDAGEPIQSSRTTTSAFKRPPLPKPAPDSDSDDLDSSRRIVRRFNPGQTASKPTPHLTLSHPTSSNSAASTTSMHKATSTISFTKPALPATRPRGTARKSRFNIDMLDDYVPPANRTSSTDATKVQAAPSPARSSVHTSVHSPSPTKPPVETKASDTWSSGLSKETAERLAKRKAEREKERESEKKSVKLEDIPTFLV